MADELNFDDIKFVDSPPNMADPPPKPPKISKPSAPTASAKPVGRPSKNSKINELQESIEGFLMLLAVPLKMRDIHDYETRESCGDMFLEITSKGAGLTPEAKELANAFATVAIDNKYLYAFFNMGDTAGKYVHLAMALQPFVLGAIHSHVRNPNAGNSSMA